MRTVLHLQNKMCALVIDGDDRVVTAVSDMDVLKGDKPYQKYARDARGMSDFDQWYDGLMARVDRQKIVLDAALDTKKVSHATQHPLRFTVGDYISLFGWSAVITDYIESPVTGIYGYWVMAAKNITRQQHNGELWRTAFDQMTHSTMGAFLSDYEVLVKKQKSDIEEVIRLSDR